MMSNKWLIQGSTWQNELLNHMSTMQKAGLLCDVSLSCSDEKIVKAHSCVLAAASEHIKALLNDVPFGSYQLKMTTVTSETWNYILRFIYDGQVLVPVERLNSINDAAVRFQMANLVSILSAPKNYNSAQPPLKRKQKDVIVLDDEDPTFNAHHNIGSNLSTMDKELLKNDQEIGNNFARNCSSESSDVVVLDSEDELVEGTDGKESFLQNHDTVHSAECVKSTNSDKIICTSSLPGNSGYLLTTDSSFSISNLPVKRLPFDKIRTIDMPVSTACIDTLSCNNTSQPNESASDCVPNVTGDCCINSTESTLNTSMLHSIYKTPISVSAPNMSTKCSNFALLNTCIIQPASSSYTAVAPAENIHKCSSSGPVEIKESWPSWVTPPTSSYQQNNTLLHTKLSSSVSHNQTSAATNNTEETCLTYKESINSILNGFSLPKVREQLFDAYKEKDCVETINNPSAKLNSSIRVTTSSVIVRTKLAYEQSQSRDGHNDHDAQSVRVIPLERKCCKGNTDAKATCSIQKVTSAVQQNIVHTDDNVSNTAKCSVNEMEGAVNNWIYGDVAGDDDKPRRSKLNTLLNEMAGAVMNNSLSSSFDKFVANASHKMTETTSGSYKRKHKQKILDVNCKIQERNTTDAGMWFSLNIYLLAAGALIHFYHVY